MQLPKLVIFYKMSHSKTSSTEEPPSSSKSPQEQKSEPPKPIAHKKGQDAITHNGFPTLTFPAQIHPRQKKFQPSADVSVVSKEVATANYERDTFVKLGIKIEECREKKIASGFSLNKTAAVVAAGVEQEEVEKSMPSIPEEVFRREDLKAPWRRYAE